MSNTGTFAADQLKSIIDRAENLDDRKAEIATDLKELFLEARGNGYDVAAIKAILKMRKEDPNERAQRETVLETYMRALGMQLDMFHSDAAE